MLCIVLLESNGRNDDNKNMKYKSKKKLFVTNFLLT